MVNSIVIFAKQIIETSRCLVVQLGVGHDPILEYPGRREGHAVIGEEPVKHVPGKLLVLHYVVVRLLQVLNLVTHLVEDGVFLGVGDGIPELVPALRS